MRYRLLTFSVWLLLCKSLQAQSVATQNPVATWNGSPATLARAAALRADGRLLTPALWRQSTASHSDRPRLQANILQFRVEANSGYVSDRNNGSLWGGRGVNGQLTSGVRYRSHAWSFAIQPELNFQQNAAFSIRPVSSGRNPVSYPFSTGLDLPQRFGTSLYTTFALGQSFLRGDFSFLGVGVATENIWWGPGLRESIVMSNTASGFPHAFVETNTPVDIGIGLWGASGFWGKLSESSYFDTIPANDHRLLTGVGMTLQPKGLENLTLGFTRLFAFSWDSLSARAFVPFFEPVLKESLGTTDNPKGNDTDDQRLSIFFLYKMPHEGFEVYGEFGREDHSWDLRDLIGEPEHSAAYLVGFQSIREIKPTRSVRVQGEWVNLQVLRASSPARSNPVYYLHPPQGHTHRGQMLGASIGPGAESQFLSVDVLGSQSSLGGFLERVRRNELAPPAVASRQSWPPLHDVELTAGLRGTRQRGSLGISAQLSYSYRLQRYFIEDDSNLRLVMQTQWAPWQK